MKNTAFKKKLHTCGPRLAEVPALETQRTHQKKRKEPCDPRALERGVRQLLADKVSGTLVGLWLLIPEYLRLGIYDLLCGWCGASPERVEPRLGLQLVNEAALCVTGLRQARSLTQRGFEAACGLPFVATDQAIHELLAQQTIGQTQDLQVALGRIRQASGHFQGRLLAIDPHRMRSYSKRQMRRFQTKQNPTAQKYAQTFFCLDADTLQPVAFTTATASRTAAQAAMDLLDLTAQIIPAASQRPLVLADTEHLSAELFDHVLEKTPFDLLAPMPRQRGVYEKIMRIAPEQWTPRWAGYATLSRPYTFVNGQNPLQQILQRQGEPPSACSFKAFIATAQRNELDVLTRDYPARWHIEEFFNQNQELGWQRAGTQNLNIRYAQMTAALMAQAAIHQLQQRLGEPCRKWEAGHLARNLLAGLDGDLRVHDDTIIVTYYNAPNAELLRQHYEHLPTKLRQQNTNPKIPWLYDFKLDFRFR